MHFSRPALLAAIATSASAFQAPMGTFSVNHFIQADALVIGRMDPIVSPGVASGHVHAVQGGNGFALNMTTQQAVSSSTCTTAYLKGDKSNYWTPALYFQDPTTKKLEAVEFDYMNVYYFFDKMSADDKIIAFPPGLRILVGDPSLRSPPVTPELIVDYSDGPVIQPVQWGCPRADTSTPLYEADSDGLHGYGIGSKINLAQGVGFPDKNCDGLYSPMLAEITMPSCWNSATDPSMVTADNPQGYKYLDTFKNKGTMAYPTKGVCPTGFSKVPRMFYEVYWQTTKFASRWTPGQKSQPFLLANGDPTGYSLHADFLAGWDTDVLQNIIDNCNTGDGATDKCPGVIANPSGTRCNVTNAIPEDLGTTTPLDQLPGNNPIPTAWGIAPEGATPAVTASNVASVATSSGAASPSVSTPTSAPVTSSLAEGVVATTTSSAFAASSGSPSTTGSTVASGWSYSGCFQDGITESNRVLTGITFANVGAVSNTKCVAYCAQAGYSMAGTEYGGQCFCGNSLSTVSKLDDSRCATACEGDGSQTCGGSLSLSVYSNAAPKSKRAEGHLRRHLQRVNSI
ncbi:WSC domain-containing protein [Lachnellula subtilissima]|uniref:WSC domain-containing protein n=1 Tax=Lachnellula subtilissima TaxID=602034 RepID=A0A8H8U8S6_9HELO|nr:WSC domain-containing protein [Lachnellula subtilissima]